MIEHVYYDEKFKVMEAKGNIHKFPDHVVHCLINTERHRIHLLHLYYIYVQ